MKTIPKIEKVKRWLESGKKLTRDQAINSHMRYINLPDGVMKLKIALEPESKWIINVGVIGKYARYWMIERGPVKNLMVNGHRIEIIDAHYINGYKDMVILVCASNGAHGLTFRVQSDAFRDRKIMKKAIQENLKKIR